jgi:predicted flap endonuclease-1-like 5' DNA nuclease
MNKIHLRAFAFGLLLSTCIFGTYYYFSGDNGAAAKLSNEELIAQVEEKGYKVVDEKAYEELEAKAKDTEATPTEEETKETETEQTDTTKEEAAKEEEKPAEAVKEYKLNIISGMQSSEIATLLKDAGIITDAFDFEQYLINTGYHTKVQLGEFVVKSDMTYEQLAKIITKS